MSLEKKLKKVVWVLAFSTQMTRTREKVFRIANTDKTAKAIETARAGKDGKKSESGENPRSNLEQVLYIRYSVTFWKKSVPVSALFDSGNEVDALYPTSAQELELFISPMEVGAQKIDSTILDTHGMVVAVFLVINKANRVRFFEKTFLVADINLKVVFEIPFLILNSTDVDFLGQELW